MTPAMKLAAKRCLPCSRKLPKLPAAGARRLSRQVPAWTLARGRLRRVVATKAFQDGLDLLVRIGRVAERENHHPDVVLKWGRLELELWTHAVGGLTENDFILAAKIDRILAP